MNACQRDDFERLGFLVLRRLLDPAALSAELDAAMRDGFADPRHLNAGSAGNQFRYLPMMCERTPVSLAAVARLSPVAAELLGAPVLPSRAKATSYLGSTRWHRDTELPVRSVGFALYLEPLEAETGALRVIPGSHLPEFTLQGDPPGVALPTLPGDAIAFDEHLFHCSSGGGLRRQWRVDFVADRPGESEILREYFARQYTPGWDGGYDVDRFPSYGDHWRTLDPRWNQRLEALGAHAAAAAEEAWVRERRGF